MYPEFLVYIPVDHKDIYESSPMILASGGCLALFLLYSKLNEIGYEVDFINADAKDKIRRYKRSILSGASIVVYPEAIVGNPLAAKNIVRWVMYYIDKEIYFKWKSLGNLVVCYWQQFIPEKKRALELRPINSIHKIFYDTGQSRNGICWRVGKGSEYHSEFNYHNPINIFEETKYNDLLQNKISKILLESVRNEKVLKLSDSLGFKEMHDVFNNYKLFISYDCESAVSVIAALSGCISIIVPKNNMKLIDLLPSHSVGIALGYNGIPHALSTRYKLHSYISKLEEYGNKSVELFAIKSKLFF